METRKPETRRPNYLFSSKVQEDEAFHHGVKIINQHATRIYAGDPILQKIVHPESSTVIFTFNQKTLADLKARLADADRSILFSNVKKMKISIFLILNGNKIEGNEGVFLELTTDLHEKKLLKISHEHASAILRFCYAMRADVTQAYNTPGKRGFLQADWDHHI